MFETLDFSRLTTEFLAHLRQPGLLYQVAILAGCLGLAWLVQRSVLARLADRPGGERLRARIGRGGLRRVLFPIVTLTLVFILRSLLKPVMPVEVLNLALPLLGSLALIRLVAYALRQAFGHVSWMGTFERAFATLAWGVVALHILGWLPEVIEGLEGVGFKVGKTQFSLWLILQGTASVLATMLLALWIGGILEQRLSHTPGLDANVRLVLVRVAKSILLLVAVMIALPMVGLDLTTLSVFGGALGVGLGLGLQKIAANYVSGFIILLDRSISIGNLISIGTDRGIVSQITTRYTVLKGATGVEVIVPNETLVGSVVLNETFTNSQVLVPINVQVAYQTDLDEAMAIMVAVATEHARTLADPPPRAYLIGFGESGIDLRLAFWINDPQEGTLTVVSAMSLEIWRRFNRAGIQFPFPQREIRVLGGQLEVAGEVSSPARVSSGPAEAPQG